jgi:transposase
MGQSKILPLDISELIPVDHICYLVIAIVNSIDVSDVEKKYRSTAGNPAYSRRMLLRLVIMASVDAVLSSRKIAKQAHENVVYMYLTGDAKPDFRTIAKFKKDCKELIEATRTIAKFKKDCKELIEATFKKTVTTAKAAGILNLAHLSTDGTKLKANASNSHSLSKEEIAEIRRILEQGIAIDKEEDKLYGDKRGDELPPELNTQAKLHEKITEVEEASGKKLKNAAKTIIEQYALGDANDKEMVIEKLDKAEEELNTSGQGAVSITDPESRFMQNKKGRKELRVVIEKLDKAEEELNTSGQGSVSITDLESRFMQNKKGRKELSYNPQISVDSDSGIIAANGVTQDCTDHHQLQPTYGISRKKVWMAIFLTASRRRSIRARKWRIVRIRKISLYMTKRMTSLYALMVTYSSGRANIWLKVSYSTPILVRTAANARFRQNVPEKAKERKSRAMTMRRNAQKAKGDC